MSARTLSPAPLNASAEAVFAALDQNGDGMISRGELERAVTSGAVVVETEPPQDMWLDKLGRAVFGGADATTDIEGAGVWRSAAAVPRQVQSPFGRPCPPQPGNALCEQGASATVEAQQVSADQDYRGYVGGATTIDLSGQGDHGFYYTLKNNHLNGLFAHMRNVWVFVGFFVLVMLVVIPVWDADKLLKDPAYTYFAGKSVPRAILSVCLSLPIFYICTISLIFKRGALRIINEQTMLGVGLVFLTALGFALILLSFPLHESSGATYKDIVFSCSTGWRVRELYQTSQALHVLRSDPACAVEMTVANCPSFQPTPYTEVLQAMERNYKCSGFCYTPNTIEVPQEPTLLQVSSQQHRHSDRMRREEGEHPGVLDPLKPAPIQVKLHAAPPAAPVTYAAAAVAEVSDAAKAAAAAMKEVQMQGHALWRKKQGMATDSRLEGRAELARWSPIGSDNLQSGWADGSGDSVTDFTPAASLIAPEVAAAPASIPSINGAAVGTSFFGNATVPPYAPTLFNQAKWQASCDGMAANTMLHGVGDIAQQFFYQGNVLMLMSILLGFMQLLGCER